LKIISSNSLGKAREMYAISQLGVRVNWRKLKLGTCRTLATTIASRSVLHAEYHYPAEGVRIRMSRFVITFGSHSGGRMYHPGRKRSAVNSSSFP
jgi:hypothetical protein